MVFERFRRTAIPPTGRMSCYGKLPCDREFLRFHLDSDEARWMVAWVDAAHHVVAAGPVPKPDPSSVELHVMLTRNGGRNLVGALIRPSRDAGGRAYPISVFSVCDGRALREQWHLLPLCAERLWHTIRVQIVGGSLADRTSLASALSEAQCDLQSVEVVRSRFEAAASAALESPWRALTGVEADRARALAVTFVQLGSAQRNARSDTDGIAVRIPLAASDPSMETALREAVWLRLFGAVAGLREPCAAVIEVYYGGDVRPPSLCLFGREPTAEDLAHLLAGEGNNAVDDLTDPWETEPTAEWALTALATLLDSQARCFADLWKGD